jgi:hypothetical protein
MPPPATRTIIGAGKTAGESSGGRGAWLSNFACPTLVHSRSSRNGLASAANAAQPIDRRDHAVLPIERADGQRNYAEFGVAVGDAPQCPCDAVLVAVRVKRAHAGKLVRFQGAGRIYAECKQHADEQ